MKSRITTTVALAALMVGAAGAANATEGWYGRGDVGYSIDGEFDIEDDGVYDYEGATFEEDWYEGLGLGYAMSNGFRVEGELSHRFNQMEPSAGLDQGGDVHAWAAMLNGYYDFNKGGAFQPYLGAGIGAARINANGADNSAVTSFDDHETTLAYQAIAGIALEVSEQLALDIGYRYFAAPEVEFVSLQPGSADRTADYTHQAVTVGLRWQFASAAPPPVVSPPPSPPVVAPPPPPPPVAAACPTSEFVVYFEWDRSNLNQQALEVIDSAVNRARQCNVNNVVVVGHTDTSGSPSYNQGLSERRASVVRDALVARGMSAGSITAQARGETDLARATNDGVREPLNRRTAVTIAFR